MGVVMNGEITQAADEHLEYRSDFENLLKHANAINWCESPDVDHPVVEIAEILKGRFVNQTA
ncbi:MAG: hypothetical protein OSA93_01225 [Akkermansiaceae bacterium]|nr:hypothetical protein [Akkermansiaceae bacterium]